MVIIIRKKAREIYRVRPKNSPSIFCNCSHLHYGPRVTTITIELFHFTVILNQSITFYLHFFLILNPNHSPSCQTEPVILNQSISHFFLILNPNHSPSVYLSKLNISSHFTSLSLYSTYIQLNLRTQRHAKSAASSSDRRNTRRIPRQIKHATQEKAALMMMDY
jgi:hypothetical protein